MIALLLAALLQDDVVAQLSDDSLEIRDAAERKLLDLGEKALPALKRSALAQARALAVRIEWEPYVPLWVAAKDETVVPRLADGDVAAFDEIVAAGGWRPALQWKAIRDGGNALKRHALAQLDVRDYGPQRASELLEAVSEEPAAVQAIVLSVRPEHAPRLRTMPRAVGLLGLAALGDAEGRRAAIADLQGAAEWRRIAAARAFARSPDPSATPALRELARNAGTATAVVAVEALCTQTDDLVDALSRDDPDVQATAFRLLVERRIDESARIWTLLQRGVFREPEARVWIRQTIEPGRFPV